jgi:hypothetical protein
MPIHALVGRIWRYVRRRIFLFLRTDLITRRRITARRDLQFVGDRYGGWVIPTGFINPLSVCYCVGCGEDISFDLGLIEKFHCAIFAFDPTPRAIAYVKDRTADIAEYHFSPIGLWDKAEELKFYASTNIGVRLTAAI